MKKVLALAVMTLILAASSVAYAWQVTIENTCNANYKVKVTGYHILWQQVDCDLIVNAGEDKVCHMPWGISPIQFDGEYWHPSEHRVYKEKKFCNEYMMFPCFRDVTLKIVLYEGQCALCVW
jgi:hypothetical protein